MIKNIKKIKAEDVEDGDILYIPEHIMAKHNEDLIGIDSFLTGADIIIIVDDTGVGINNDCVWLVNGGEMFYCHKNDILYKLGHYSEFNKIIENDIVSKSEYNTILDVNEKNIKKIIKANEV